ncbi:MAG TPA: hypothetical protein VF841_18015 [Anaeromyxobacter sp.]
MRIGSVVVACTSLLTVVACGRSSSSPAGPSVASSAAITQYQDLTASVQSAAVTYGTTMSDPAMTAGGCAAAHDAYDAQVRPWISQMVQMSGAMDAFMDAHNGYAYADMACVANAMLQELDAHRTVACTFSTLGGDQTEASRHVGVMTSLTGHAYDRCGQMMGGQYSWSPPAPACGGTSGGTPTDPLALGQRIFDTGIGTNGLPIARTGGYMMMGSSGCATCHGYDGLGRITMMFTTPNITYANLTDPAGMLAPDGTRGTTYTDDLIRRAVTQGLDADGAPLSTVMPRWQLGDLDWADLLLYLKALPAAGTTGGGGATPPPPAGAGTIGGTAFMGGVRSGTIAAYAVDGSTMGPLLGTSTVSSSGSFTVPVGGYAGVVLLRMSGGTFVDEATGTTMTMQPGDVLTSSVPAFTANSAMTGVQVTPLTSMAQARAQDMAGGMTAANVAAANAGVGTYFDVGDILMTAPMDPAVAGSGAAADASAKNYGMTVAAMSQYARTIGMTTSSSGIFTAMMRDASDGVMNGMMGTSAISMGGMSGMGGGMMGGGYTMQANAGTTGLAGAMTAFVGSSRNASGVPMADMQPLVDKLNASSGTIP